MKARNFSLAYFASVILCSGALAQDYPYDDVELKKDDSTPKVATENPDTTESAPTTPSNSGGSPRTGTRKRSPALFRIGLKAGGTYTIFQSPDSLDSSRTIKFDGFGFEGLLALGWDLPYQPIFIEFETGYRGLLMTAGEGIPPLHVIPVAFGLHYRTRMSKSSVWKPGVKSSFDIRIAEDPDGIGNTFGIFPALSISSLMEFDNFLIEPMMTISRIQSQFNFVVFALRAGMRF